MAYYTRFVQSQEQARADLERGYSFSDYALFETVEDVLEHFGIENAESVEIGRDNFARPGWYGIALNGLCGFGPFDTIEEAEEYAHEKRGYNGIVWPAAAIFEGYGVSDDRVWDGDCFVARALVKIIEFEVK